MDNVGQAIISIEKRLSKIEQHLGIGSISTPDNNVAGPWARPDSLPAAQVISSEVYQEKPGNWLGIVAVICFVLAAGFIVKLSIESGWLNPMRQITIAMLLGMALIGSGFALMKSDKEYASLLPAAGVIILYLSVFAAYRYYELISFETAIFGVSLVSAACIWLYTRIRHDIYAVTAAVGAYCAPVVLGLNVGAGFSLYYFVLCSAAFAVISIMLQSRILTLVSSYMAIFMSAVAGQGLGQDIFVAAVLAVHFFVFSFGTYLYTQKHNTPLTQQEAWSFLPVLLIFYAMEYNFIGKVYPDVAPWISLGFSGVLLGLYFSAKKYFPDGMGSQSLVLAFTAIVAFHSGYLEILPADFRPWLFIGIMGVLAFSTFDFSSQKHGGAFAIPRYLILAVLGMEYISMLSHLLDSGNMYWVMLSVLAVLSMWCVIIFSSEVESVRTYGALLLGAAHLLAITGLYRLTTDIGSLAVSASWLLYAVGVMVFAFSIKDKVISKSALVVLAFAAGKALLFDAASAPTIVRILCLLLTGAVLYGCGLLMRRIADWKA